MADDSTVFDHDRLVADGTAAALRNLTGTVTLAAAFIARTGRSISRACGFDRHAVRTRGVASNGAVFLRCFFMPAHLRSMAAPDQALIRLAPWVIGPLSQPLIGIAVLNVPAVVLLGSSSHSISRIAAGPIATVTRR